MYIYEYIIFSVASFNGNIFNVNAKNKLREFFKQCFGSTTGNVDPDTGSKKEL